MFDYKVRLLENSAWGTFSKFNKTGDLNRISTVSHLSQCHLKLSTISQPNLPHRIVKIKLAQVGEKLVREVRCVLP